jgi:hypothetical protein
MPLWCSPYRSDCCRRHRASHCLACRAKAPSAESRRWPRRCRFCRTPAQSDRRPCAVGQCRECQREWRRRRPYPFTGGPSRPAPRGWRAWRLMRASRGPLCRSQRRRRHWPRIRPRWPAQCRARARHHRDLAGQRRSPARTGPADFPGGGSGTGWPSSTGGSTSARVCAAAAPVSAMPAAIPPPARVREAANRALAHGGPYCPRNLSRCQFAGVPMPRVTRQFLGAGLTISVRDAQGVIAAL